MVGLTRERKTMVGLIMEKKTMERKTMERKKKKNPWRKTMVDLIMERKKKRKTMLLPFEAIPVLMEKFREPVKAATNDCPRMCKSIFKSTNMKGYPLSYLNEALGNSKDIHSIMKPRLEEIPLMEDIMDALEDDDHYDAIVDGWMKMLDEKKNIWFEKMFNDDVEGRKVDMKTVSKAKEKRKVQESGDDCFEVLKDLMEAGLKERGDKVTNLELEVSEKLADLDKKVKYSMKFLPPMDEATGKEKVVESGEHSSVKDKEVMTGVEKEVEGGEELGGEELGGEELGGEPSL
ncbi:hypothetical protein AALP_AA6G200200 [Arabis alpina]|uniref:DUF287 domain-containing protein n=1 Tax=Arabis alpina TaxID=50452 RepID=A0A087GQG1_ARAAL|nr:hypothetical protein AALP_AA6G200200 [Arabis alpina]